MAFQPVHLTSPHMHGQLEKDIEYLLSGHNRFKQDFHPGKASPGVFDESDAAATRRAKHWLGYPPAQVSAWQGTLFGENLYGYLLPKGHKGWKPLPTEYRKRRERLLAQAKAQQGVNAKALAWALAEAKKGVTEWPAGSNANPYGEWWGLNRQPWCAIFFSEAQLKGGDKRVFKRGVISAYAYWIEQAARSGHPFLRITHNPEPGDACVFHEGQGHIGRFVKWESKTHGSYLSVEGNTSSGGSQTNGGAVLVQHRSLGWAPTVFVRVLEP